METLYVLRGKGRRYAGAYFVHVMQTDPGEVKWRHTKRHVDVSPVGLKAKLFCYQNFLRFTGIRLKPGELLKIRFSKRLLGVR